MKMIAPLIMCILGTFLWWQFQGPESVEPEKRIPIPRITISFIEQVIDQTISTANTTVQTVPLTDTDEVTTNTQEASSETLIETTETPETMQAETQIENATAQTTEPSSCSRLLMPLGFPMLLNASWLFFLIMLLLLTAHSTAICNTTSVIKVLAKMLVRLP